MSPSFSVTIKHDMKLKIVRNTFADTIM